MGTFDQLFSYAVTVTDPRTLESCRERSQEYNNDKKEDYKYRSLRSFHWRFQLSTATGHV
jgi:hypothetical protein